MTHTSKKLDDSQIELTVTVTSKEYAPHLTRAAERLTARLAIRGFRKGHVPYDVAKKELGEMAILQEALESIVQQSYVESMKAEKLDVIGMPQISIEKVAPDNDVIYKATVALLPKVTLADLSNIQIEKKEAVVSDEKVSETLDALRGMHAEEIAKEGPAEGTDKLIIDLNMLLDNVPVDGGQSKNYQVYLGENHYVPGFNEQVTGLKKDESKQFTLDFPKTHYQKMLAGKSVQFDVKVKEIFSRALPALDETFAKKLGQESIEKLKGLIQNNMLQEEKQRVSQQEEIQILDQLIEKSTFETLPEILVDSERHKIFYELKRDLERNGITIEQYLQDIKQKEEDLFKGFTEQAVKRAKAALISRQVAKEHDISVTDEDLQKEIDTMNVTYKDDEQALENLKRSDVRDSIASMLQNKKVMTFLKEKILGVKTETKSV